MNPRLAAKWSLDRGHPRFAALGDHAYADSMSGHRPEVADVFAQYGSAYQRAYGPSVEHRRILRALTSCRAAALGGHKKRRDTYGHETIAYNSCRNRHCPKCQAAARVATALRPPPSNRPKIRSTLILKTES